MRQNRIDQTVAQEVLDYVNETKKIVRAQVCVDHQSRTRMQTNCDWVVHLQPMAV